MQRPRKRMFPERLYECKYCNKKFSSPRILSKHVCIIKQRYKDQRSIGSRIGFIAYRRFYEISYRCKNKKTFQDFIRSKYYGDFIRFGRHLVEIEPLDAEQYIDFVLYKHLRMPDWISESLYKEFVKTYVLREFVEPAIERSLVTLKEWGKDRKMSYNMFFIYGAPDTVITALEYGLLSPWLFILSPSAKYALANFSPKQQAMLKECINTIAWKRHIEKNPVDKEFVINVIRQCRL